VALLVAGAALSMSPTVAVPLRFDLQAHRGGMALRPENTLEAFGNALRLGVSTLELDVQITRDGHAVVTHDRRVEAGKCVDTTPATPGDPQFPYVGELVHTLTLDQLRTIDCGSRTHPRFPGQVPVPGARMPLLREVFDLLVRHRAHDVTVNVELKVHAGAPSETAPRERFVRVVADHVRAAGMLPRVTIQSFDWATLMLMRRVEPRLPITALIDHDSLRADASGISPWLGGLDLADFGGDPVAAVHSFGVDAFAPVHGFPEGGGVNNAGYRPYVTRDLVRRAHGYGIPVIPWTVDDPDTMNKLLDDGVDGIITNRPDVLRTVLAARLLPLPAPAGRDAADVEWTAFGPTDDARIPCLGVPAASGT
jgi:glycerophosphoryl diester phosphodiesterase